MFTSLPANRCPYDPRLKSGVSLDFVQPGADTTRRDWGIRMKKALLGVLAAAAILASGYASAADMPVKAPPPPAPVYSWSGFYLGVSVGGRWSDPTWTTNCVGANPCSPSNIFAAFATANPSVSFDEPTVRAGGYFGYNWQLSPLWVAGLETDLAYGDGSHTMAGIPGLFTAITGPGGASSSLKEGWDGSIRARLGFLVTPAVLIYGTGGVAWQRVEAEAQCPAFGSSCSLAVADQETYSRTLSG